MSSAYSPLSGPIDEARKQGYSDDDILGHLSQTRSDLAPKIQEAQQNGYESKEIVDHLHGPGALQRFGSSFAGTLGLGPEDIQAEEQRKPTFASELGNFALDAPQSMAARIGWNIAKNTYQHLKAFGQKVAAGESGAPDIAGAVPLVGPMAYKVGEQAEQGDYAGAAGTATGTLLQAGMPELIRGGGRAASAVKAAAKKPGTGKIMLGAGETAIGVGAMSTNHPLGWVYGGAQTLRGLGNIIRGIAENKAKALEEAAQPNAAPPNQFTGSRNTSWNTVPENQPTKPQDQSPITGPLPSGRAPGKVTTPPSRTPAWAGVPTPAPAPAPNVTPIQGPLPSGRVPGRMPTMPPPESAPAPTPVSTAPKTATIPAAPVPETSPQEASRRTSLAKDYATALHAEGNGIHSSQLEQMGAPQWKEAAKLVDAARGVPKGVARTKPPSQQTIAAILQEMKRLEGIQDTKVQLRDALVQ